MDKNDRYYRELEAFRNIIEHYFPSRKFDRILVLGCGKGREAAIMQQILNTPTIGVDIFANFDSTLKAQIELITFNGYKLPFRDHSFDLVYSYHVLEHADYPALLIKEVQRILQPDGFFYLGVPNKDRIVGYFGMKNRSMWQKITSNIRDWHKRLQNQWINPVAHAGFTQNELERLLSLYFKSILPVSKDYYSNKWPRLERFLHLLWLNGWHRKMSPSLYMIAQK